MATSVDKAVEQALKLPESTQYAIVKVLENYSNGAFWGFAKKEEALSVAESVKTDPNVRIFILANPDDVLVEVNPKYFTEAVVKTAPELVKQEDIRDMQEAMKTALGDFQKFLMNKKKKGYRGYVGIYCTNDTPTIRYKEVSYPAFRVNLQTFLEGCQQYGFNIEFNGKTYSPAQVKQMGAEAYRLLQQSPTATGLFVKISG